MFIAKSRRRIVVSVSIALAAALVFANYSAPSLAQEPDVEDRGFYQSYVLGTPDEPSRDWMIAYGGRLYDLWWAVLLQDGPDGTHPAYPAAGQRPGLNSWRCVACHGWDYRGKDGDIASGPRYTGIKGIEGAVGADPAQIVALLRDDTHRFTREMIPDGAALALALFVSQGQIDSADALEPGSRRFHGDPERGRAVFQNVCAICHDYDGGAWIEGDVDIGGTLGAIATNDPARALHKVMNGQTYADMPAMRVFGLETVVDVLSYVQGLPHD